MDLVNISALLISLLLNHKVEELVAQSGCAILEVVLYNFATFSAG